MIASLEHQTGTTNDEVDGFRRIRHNKGQRSGRQQKGPCERRDLEAQGKRIPAVHEQTRYVVVNLTWRWCFNFLLAVDGLVILCCTNMTLLCV